LKQYRGKKRAGSEGQDESDLIKSGEVDALFHAAEPRAYLKGHPQVARLFPDYRAVERDYYARTGSLRPCPDPS
jgi:4,5-dihydroxyphthalate decarboxylase